MLGYSRMIYYNQNQRYFQYKDIVSYVPVIKIDIATIIVMVVSYFQVIENSNSFGSGSILNAAPHLFMTISFAIFVLVNVSFIYMLIKQKEIHADLNQGLIFIYKKRIFSEKKLINEKPLNEYYSVDIKLLTKTKKNLILLRQKTGNLSFIIGQNSCKNTENFDPELFLQDLEHFFSSNNNLKYITD